MQCFSPRHASSKSTLGLVFGCLGMLALAGCSENTQPAGGVQVPADGLQQVLIRFEVNGTPAAPFVDLATHEVFFSFQGDMFAPTVDPATGQVTGHGAASIGHFGPAEVAFKVNPTVPITSAGFISFRCLDCVVHFNPVATGAELKPLLPPNPDDPVTPDQPYRSLAFDIPMEGTFLQNLGPVLPDRAGTIGIGIRGYGCGGTQEVRGKGLLARGRGTICMNGQFDISTPDSAQIANLLQSAVSTLTGLMNPSAVPSLLKQLASTTFKGESNCAITLHVAQH